MTLATVHERCLVHGAGPSFTKPPPCAADGVVMSNPADAIVLAAEDSVSVYLHECGPIVTFNTSWFAEVFESDAADKDPPWSWCEYRDAAKAAHRRSQSADLARDPREDESQWRTEITELP